MARYGKGGYGAGFYGTVSDVATRITDRLEDLNTFWSLKGEIFPLLVEAMMAATLITGDPQIRATSVTTIPWNIAPTGFTPLPMPADALALLRVDGAGGLSIDKCLVWDLDRHYPGWEVQIGPQAQYWFPFGLTQFGIYPSLTQSQQVLLTYIQTPVTVNRPYTGNEAIPFASEFVEAFEGYASAMASFKEGSPEFDQAQQRLQVFLSRMEELSNFAYRRGSLRFSRSMGVQSRISEVVAK